MENLKNQKNRDKLANKTEKAPEYLQSKGESISESQDEEKIEDGLGILVKIKTLYHGSGISGIKSFNIAEEDTVGSGVYFTSEPKDAISYARVRSGNDKKKNPTIYEVQVKDIKLLDLRKNENIKLILGKFKFELLKRKSTIKPSGNPVLDEVVQTMLNDKIKAIEEDKVDISNIRLVTISVGEDFSTFIQSLGYDGLVTYEGGEGSDFADHDHDTYLIFDPEKVKIIREHKIL